MHDVESYLATHELSIAGRETTGCWDAVKRYCGLPWRDGPQETWAFQFYDAVNTDPSVLERVDLLAAGVLHPGLGRDDLTSFAEAAASLSRWLDRIPQDRHLTDASGDLVNEIASMTDLQGSASTTLLSKIVHRKRPLLIPLLDRHVVDRYRPITGERRPHLAWPALIPAIQGDIKRNATYLARCAEEIRRRTGVDASPLRVLDIAIWMEAQQ